jgi:hypothetical protein
MYRWFSYAWVTQFSRSQLKYFTTHYATINYKVFKTIVKKAENKYLRSSDANYIVKLQKYPLSEHIKESQQIRSIYRQTDAMPNESLIELLS